MAVQPLQLIMIVALIGVCLTAEWRFPMSRASVAAEAEHWAGNQIRLLRQVRPTGALPSHSNPREPVNRGIASLPEPRLCAPNTFRFDCTS